MKSALLGIFILLVLPMRLGAAPFTEEDFTPANPLVMDAYQKELEDAIRLSQAREMREDFQVYTYPFTREYVRLRFQKEIHSRLLDASEIARSLEDLNAFKPWSHSFLFPVFVENFQGTENPLHFNPDKVVLGYRPKDAAGADWSWLKPALISSPPTRLVPGRSVFVFSLDLTEDQLTGVKNAGKMTLIISDLADRPVSLETSNWLSLEGLFDETDPQGERERIGIPEKLGIMY